MSLIMIELLSTAALVLAVSGVVMNNHRIIYCFYLWFVSNAISAGIHFSEGLVMLGVRDVVFFALAIQGLIIWRRHGRCKR
jgi:nicotinamide riboside transporter PnuC